MKFDINNYGINTAMHCSTEEQAITFCNHLHALGKQWNSGLEYDKDTHFEKYGSNTCYYFRTDTFGDLSSSLNCRVLEFTDFEWDGYTPPPKEEPIKLRFTW